MKHGMIVLVVLLVLALQNPISRWVETNQLPEPSPGPTDPLPKPSPPTPGPTVPGPPVPK
jgi:hypothetical protein